MKSIIQKGITHIQKGIIPAKPNPKTRNFKPVDHVKCEGQVKSQHLLFVQFSA